MNQTGSVPELPERTDSLKLSETMHTLKSEHLIIASVYIFSKYSNVVCFFQGQGFPDGLLRNRSLILTCEVSEVTDSLMLVCLRMERNRGVLGKQQIMTEKNNKLQLTVNLSSYETDPLSSYETDPLHWQCAVFTEDTLRALAPITISLSSSSKTSTLPNKGNILTINIQYFSPYLGKQVCSRCTMYMF